MAKVYSPLQMGQHTLALLKRAKCQAGVSDRLQMEDGGKVCGKTGSGLGRAKADRSVTPQYMREALQARFVTVLES